MGQYEAISTNRVTSELLLTSTLIKTKTLSCILLMMQFKNIVKITANFRKVTKCHMNNLRNISKQTHNTSKKDTVSTRKYCQK